MSKSPNISAPMDYQRKMLMALIFSAVCIFMLGAGGLYLINNKIVDNEKIVADKQAQVGTNEQIARRYQSTLDEYNTTAQQLRYLEPKMTQQAYVATLIQQLQTATTAEHLKLLSVRPQDVPDSAPARVAAPAPGQPPTKAALPTYKQLLCAISVTGTYDQIMRFVYDMPHFPKIVSVQGIALHPAAQAPGTGEPVLSADIGLQAYVFDDSLDPAGIPAPNATVAASPGPAGPSMVSYDSNPIAYAAGRAAGVARADVRASDVEDRSGGLLEASKQPHSIVGGLGSEQQVPIR